MYRFYIYDLYFSVLIENVYVDPHNCQEIYCSKLLVLVAHSFINFSKQNHPDTN